MVTIHASGQRLIGCAMAWVAIDSAAVLLRLIAKRKTKGVFTLDDAWCIVALTLIIVFNFLQIAAVVKAGGSLDETAMTAAQLTGYLKFLYIADIFWAAGITAVKMSLLFFYRRVFTTRSFRRTSLLVDALCWVWFLVVVFVLVFQCDPIAAAWEIALAPIAKCQPLGNLIFGPEFTNIFLDVIILALPVRIIRTLQMHPRQKVLISLVFLFGGLVCITGVIRIAMLYRPRDGENFNTAVAIILDSVEVGCALVCACLPIYKSLLPKEMPLLSSLADWLSSLRTTSAQSTTGGPGLRPSNASRHVYSKQKPTRYNQFDSGSYDEVHLTSVEGVGIKENQDGEGKSFPVGRIAVQKTIDVI